MAITYIQSAYATPQTTVSTVAVAYASAQSVGSLNIIAVGLNDATTNVNSVVDSSGNTYSLAIGPTRGTALSQSIYYAANIKAAAANANIVTVTFNTTTIHPDVRILEYSGLAPTSPLDVTAAANGSGTASNSGSATTTVANELIFGAGMTSNSTTSAGTGFTLRIKTVPDADSAIDQIVSATGTYSASVTTSTGAWVMQMATFKASSPIDFFAIDSSGHITITGSGPAGISAQVYNLHVRASNAAGSGTAIVPVTFAAPAGGGGGGGGGGTGIAAIPTSFTHSSFTGMTERTDSVALASNQVLTRQSFIEHSSNPATIITSPGCTVNFCRVRSNECVRGGGGVMTFNNCYLEANDTSTTDHSDVIQCYAPGTVGATLALNNTMVNDISVNRTSNIWCANQWSGTVRLSYVIIGASPYGIRLVGDNAPGITLYADNVYFVGPFQFGRYLFQNINSPVTIAQWTNVFDATIDGSGNLIVGAAVPHP